MLLRCSIYSKTLQYWHVAVFGLSKAMIEMNGELVASAELVPARISRGGIHNFMYMRYSCINIINNISCVWMRLS